MTVKPAWSTIVCGAAKSCGKVCRPGRKLLGIKLLDCSVDGELNQRRAHDESEIARLRKYTHFISVLLVEILMPFDVVLFVKAGKFTS